MNITPLKGVIMSTPTSTSGSGDQVNYFYKLTAEGDHLDFHPISRDEKGYSALETLRSVEKNLDKLKTNKTTIEYVERIFKASKAELEIAAKADQMRATAKLNPEELTNNQTGEEHVQKMNQLVDVYTRIKQAWTQDHHPADALDPMQAGPSPSVASDRNVRIPIENCVGTAIVTAKIAPQKKEVQIWITMSEGKYGMKVFKAQNESHETLGTMVIDWYRTLPNGNFGSDNNPGVDSWYSDRYYLKGRDKQRLNTILIESINTSFGTHKGVGTALIQAAMEYGFSKGCEGRLVTNAVRNAPPFYYKLGMRCLKANDNTKIKRDIKKPRALTDLSSFYMWMTPLKIEEMKERIRNKPIFASASQYLGPKVDEETEVLDVFSESDRKTDADTINDLLNWNKLGKKHINLEPQKVYAFLRLFPEKDRIYATKKYMEMLDEVDAKDVAELFDKKTRELKAVPEEQRLTTFAGLKATEEAAAVRKMRTGPLKEIDEELLKLFTEADRDNHAETIINLDTWIHDNENDNTSYSDFYKFLRLFPNESRIVAAKTLISLGDLSDKHVTIGLKHYEEEEKALFFNKLYASVEQKPVEARLDFFKNYSQNGG